MPSSSPPDSLSIRAPAALSAESATAPAADSANPVSYSAGRRRTVLYVLLLAVALAVIAWAGASQRKRVLRWLADDRGPVQTAQGAVLIAALLISGWELVRVVRKREPCAAAVCLTFGVFVLAAREVEIEHFLLGTRAFSWGGFFDPDRPLAVKLGLYLPTLALTIAVLVFAAVHRRELRHALKVHRPLFRIGLWAAGVFLFSQVFDLGRSISRRFRIGIFRNDLIEEMIELVGEFLVLVMVIEFGIRSRERIIEAGRGSGVPERVSGGIEPG